MGSFSYTIFSRFFFKETRGDNSNRILRSKKAKEAWKRRKEKLKINELKQLKNLAKKQGIKIEVKDV